MSDWKAIGAKIGEAVGRLFEPLIGDQMRNRYAVKYGRCRRCDVPLADYSLSMICDHCHFEDLLKSANGGGSGGDA